LETSPEKNQNKTKKMNKRKRSESSAMSKNGVSNSEHIDTIVQLDHGIANQQAAFTKQFRN